MYLRYLVANAAWVFVFGDSLVPMGGTHFFDSRTDAVAAASRCRLGVERNGKVVVAEDVKA